MQKWVKLRCKSTIRAQSGAKDDSFSFILEMPFYDTAKLIAKVIEKSPKAVIFSRGGDDETTSLWDNPDFVNQLVNLGIPFYTALGHAHRLTVAEHYADEAFETPSSLGSAIRTISKEIEKYKTSVIKLSASNKSLNDINACY